MLIKGHIDINQSRDKVVAIFSDPQYLKEYQDGFIKKELITGDAGQDGAISMMYYKNGKFDIDLEETITKNDLPHSFEAYYHHKHMDNTMKCTFTELDLKRTRYDYEYEYTRISWIMPKLISVLFPNMYKKPAEKWLLQFKAFVEQL